MAATYRQAAVEDAAEIHALLLRLASEIPLLVDTLEREEALYALIRRCARSGETLVALDEAGRIVAVALAEPNQRGRHYAEGEALDLHHAVAAPEQSGRGIFPALLGHVLARMMPVVTTVSPQNRTGVSKCLAELGFRDVGGAGGERRVCWKPG